jgi:formate dehydrogenase subunit gamma
MALAVMMLGFMTAQPVIANGTAPDFPTVSGPPNTRGTHSISDMWRDIRQGKGGLVTIGGPEGGVAINANGTWWSQLRAKDGVLIQTGAMVLAGILAIVAVYYALRRRIPIEGGRSGRKIARFSLTQRVVHWTIACVFLLLAFTGLILLFGRPFVIPLIGKGAFGVLASASMQVHNLFGPIFAISLVALFFSFVRGNFPSLSDFRWLLKGGGLLGGHVRAGRYNAGEKGWFWIVVLAGILLSGSGFVLLFPGLTAARDLMQDAGLIHGIAALIFIGFAIGHIYLGSIGTEGTLEGMTTGDVDENWARTHHDLWLEQSKANSERDAT